MKVLVENEIGTEINTYLMYKEAGGKNLSYPVLNPLYQDFEDNVKKYPAPGVPDGIHECELIETILGLKYG